MSIELPKTIVMRSKLSGKYLRHVQKPEDEKGLVTNTESKIFEPFCKIAVEVAKSDERYVNLRFSQSNKYWARESGGSRVSATSDKAEEDTSKESCTLFYPFQGEDGSYSLKHVGSGLTVTSPCGNDGEEHLFLGSLLFPGMYIEVSFVVLDWETIVVFPNNVALKGDNDKYLKAVFPYLQYSSQEGNESAAGFQVSTTPDGFARFKSNSTSNFWIRSSSSDWITLDSSNALDSDRDTLFWPVLDTGNIIALRSAANNRFCQRLTSSGNTDCLNAVATTITDESKIRVEELVLDRKITGITFLMDNARIYDEVPYSAGTATADNTTDNESSVTAQISHEYQHTYSFTKTSTVSFGVTTTFETGIPFIEEGKIEVSAETSNETGWGSTVSETITINASYTATIPPHSVVTVEYVGTMGKCDVPFSYTQQDKLSHDGHLVTSRHIDGVFTGINAFNFQFTEHKIMPL